MRNKRWLRYSLASLTVMGVGLGGFLVACGDDDSGVTANPPDSGGGGNGDTGTTTETGTPGDSGGDSGPKDAGQLAKLQLVNAATDFGPSNTLGALRVCYGVGPDEAKAIIAPLPPLPDRKGTPTSPFAGLFIGTGGAVQGTGTDLTTLVLVPYVFSAATLFVRGIVKPDGGPGTACDALMDGARDAGGALTINKDYWKLPTIPAGTFAREKSYMLILTGCTSDSTAGAKCGAGFDAGAPGNGNLKINIFEIDRATAIGADKLGAQYIHASTVGDSALGPAMQSPGFIANPNDSTTFKGITGDGGVEGGVGAGYLAKTPLIQVTGINVAQDSFTVNPLVADLAIPLPLIQAISYGATVPDGGAYANGKAFTFIAVGDPGENPDAGGNFNTKKFHYIALPNDPVTGTYDPK